MTSNTPKTVKILSLDGGGMKGYFSATFLKRFCQDANINGNELYKAFDLMAGTSIGGIQALGLSYGKSPDDMMQLLATQGPKIFNSGSSLPLSAYKFSVIMGLPTFPSSFYQQVPLKNALTSVFGPTLKLSDLPGNVIVSSWNSHQDQSTFFSNINNLEPFLTGSDQTAVDVGLATSAAPLYFPTASVSGQTMIDGGVCVNNPVAVAYSVAKKMYPSCTRFYILSVGAGSAHNDFVPEAAKLKGMLSQFNPPLLKDAADELAKNIKGYHHVFRS